MATSFFDRVQMTVSGTPGTGTITLGSAVTGFRAFPVSAGNKTISYFIVDGTAWEVGKGVYTTSGTTLTRALEASSTSSLLSLTSSALVYCTISAADAVAVNLSVPTAPQGRLTLQAATPVMTADVTAVSTIYYVPYVGKNIPIYDGTIWAMSSIGTGLSMALDTSNQLLNNSYDLFVWNNAGTISIGAGPAWINTATITMTIATPAVVTWTGHGLIEGDPVVFTNSGGALPTGITAGTTYFVGRSPATNTFNVSTTLANSAAGTFIATTGSQSGTHTGTNSTRVRGTGAGTSELELKDGFWTNKNSITLKNGAGAGTSGITANTATYIGSFFCTANGQTGMAFQPAATTSGTNNVLGLWNAYQRKTVMASCRNNTTSNPAVNGTSTTWTILFGVAMRITWIDGLAQSDVSAAIGTHMVPQASTNSFLAMNMNNTNGNPQKAGGWFGASFSYVHVSDAWKPSLGVNYVQQVYAVTSGTGAYYFASTSPTAQNNFHQIALEM